VTTRKNKKVKGWGVFLDLIRRFPKKQKSLNFVEGLKQEKEETKVIFNL
jgi:hypothetical protein